jgi:hypothetical protein
MTQQATSLAMCLYSLPLLDERGRFSNMFGKWEKHTTTAVQ